MAGWQFSELKSFGNLTNSACYPDAGVIRGREGMLFGTTSAGGTRDQGIIFKVNRQGGKFQVLYSFTNSLVDGSAPKAPLVESKDGYLYGTTYAGGSQGAGILFKIAEDGSDYQLLHSFTSSPTDGAYPQIRLVEGKDGALYGITSHGGSNFTGVIFKMDKGGGNYRVLYHFENNVFPTADPLLVGHDGKLYGVGNGGSGPAGGVVFRLNNDGSDFEVLHQFDGTNGSAPRGPLVESGGWLTGTTFGGGKNGAGTVFRLKEDGSAYTITGSFGLCNGAGKFVQAGGMYFGVSVNDGLGEGTLFSKNPEDGSVTVLHSFGSYLGDGSMPISLFSDGAAIYGVTYYGGRIGCGTVFTYRPASKFFQILYNFDNWGGEGVYPQTQLSQDADGNIYGTTANGGLANVGTVFTLRPDGSGYKTLWSFLGGTLGQFPRAVIADPKGGLYGTTYDGGKSKKTLGHGMVYRLKKGRFKALHVFSGPPADGEYPMDGVLLGSDNVLYGTAQFGQNNGSGVSNVVFSGDPEGRHYRVLRVLTNFSYAFSFSIPELIEGPDHALYGCFVQTVFKVSKDGQAYQELHTFDSDLLNGPLLLASDGKLYGVTAYGTGNHGTVYRIDPDGSGFETLFTFPESAESGSLPNGPLAEGRDGMMYGVTSDATPEIFRLNKDGTGFEILHNVEGNPGGGLMLGSDGAFYGTTITGGSNGAGTAFKLYFTPD